MMDNIKNNNLYGSIGEPLSGVKLNYYQLKKFINKENTMGEICVKTPAIFQDILKRTKEDSFF